MKMSTDYNLKAFCSVIEMTKQLDLSRTRFYQLQKQDVFTMNDRQAHAAMNSMCFDVEKTESRTVLGQSGTHFRQSLPQPALL